MSEPNKTYADDLIKRLKAVNSITGLASIIDLCAEAANYISNTEQLRSSIEGQLSGFNQWSEIRKKRKEDGWK